MKLVKTSILAIAILAISSLFYACSDDDNVNPIGIKDWEANTTINLLYDQGASDGYLLELQGGDGNYTVKSSNADIILPEIVSTKTLRLKVLNIGNAIITITDNSQRTLVVNVSADYYTTNYVVELHDIQIDGGDLTENEKKAIRNKQLAEIPVKVNGGYKLIYTDKANKKGKAIIYTDNFGVNGVETTFEMIENAEGERPQYVGYEIIIENEKRTFILGQYRPSVRKEMVIPMALKEDITLKVQKEYPKAEFVYTSQLVIRKP